MDNEIAIIGMAGRFPEADDLEALHRNLLAGRDSVRPLSEARRRRTALRPNSTYMVAGYLEDIDLFDPEIFGLSPAEAEEMDPHQRFLLEVTHQAIENAGYSPASFDGTNCAVFVGDAVLEYHRHAEEETPTLVTGNMKSFLSTHIARQFGLNGNAVVVDGACASSLIAVHLACNELLLGDAEFALACGVNLFLFPEQPANRLGVWSPDGKSRAFSAQADGMSRGEVAACVLLRPLADALADGDVIHAVLRGAATNNNGRRSASLTAPDARAQTEVITRAWRKAGIDPKDLGFIEAHGSGTKLGDEIEIGGLNGAFTTAGTAAGTGTGTANDGSTGVESPPCPVSTIKSQTGHALTAAGISGLFRAVLSLKHEVRYPQIHCQETNPLIDFEASTVRVNTAPEPWPPRSGKPRLAAVSSIGLSGLNCHVVLSEAPPRPPQPPRPEGGPDRHLVTVSAHTPAALLSNLHSLGKFLKAYRPALADVSRTLVGGRLHQPRRVAVLVGDLEELGAALAAFEPRVEEVAAVPPLDKLVLIFSDPATSNTASNTASLRAHKVFRETLEEVAETTDRRHPGWTDPHAFAFQYAFYKLLEHHGITSEYVLGIGIGAVISALLDEELTLDEALDEAVLYEAEPIAGIGERVARLLEREAGEGSTVFLDLAGEGTLGAALRAQTADRDGLYYFGLDYYGLHYSDLDHPTDPFLALRRELFLAGFEARPRFVCDGGGRRIELPVSSFDRRRLWLRDEPLLPVEEDTVEEPALATLAASHLVETCEPIAEKITEQIAKQIASWWADHLDQRQFALDDHFFDLGGDSLKATKVINRIVEKFDVPLDFEDAFALPTLGQLVDFVRTHYGTRQQLAGFWKEVLKVDQVEPTDDFFALGGHSLLANRVLFHIEQELGLELNFEHIFRYPVLEDLAEFIDARQSAATNANTDANTDASTDAGPASIEPLPERTRYRLAPAQERLWLLCALDGASVAYNSPFTCSLRGALDTAHFAKALDSLVERHEALRTVFAVGEDSRPYQRVLAAAETGFVLVVEDVSGDGSGHQIEQQIRREALAPFDLGAGPLLRARLLRCSAEHHVFILTIHHLVSDAWSMEILWRELLEIYGAARSGRSPHLDPLPIQAKDFAAWHLRQLSEGSSTDLDYWRRKLRDLSATELPTDLPRPMLQSFRGASIEFVLEAEQVEGLTTVGHAAGVTRYMLLVAVIKTLLHRLSGSDDVVVGSQTSGRDHPDTRDLVGFFVNTLLLRTAIHSEDSLRQVLARVKGTILEAFEHRACPFDRIVDGLEFERLPNRSPLFDIQVDFYAAEHHVFGHHAEAGFEVLPQAGGIGTHSTKYDLSIVVSASGETIHFNLTYNTDLYHHTTIETFRERLLKVADAFVADLDRRVSEVNLLDETHPADDGQPLDVQLNI